MAEAAKVKETKTPVVEKTKETYKIGKNPIIATGRRKTSVSRVFLYETKGEFLVNHQTIEEYFPSEKEKLAWMQPFHLVGVSHPESKFSGNITVEGSGKSGQLGAVIHGISRALASLSEENQIILRRNGYMTRDSRMVERKKPYLRKARKAPQYSKR